MPETEPKVEVGTQVDVKPLGKLYMQSFKLVDEDGNVVLEPWGGKNAYPFEWARNDSAFTGTAREEKGSFFKLEKDATIYVDDRPRKLDIAIFTSDVDGDAFDVAARLVPEALEPGDPVKLVILGCCSLVSVTRIED